MVSPPIVALAAVTSRARASSVPHDLYVRRRPPLLFPLLCLLRARHRSLPLVAGLPRGRVTSPLRRRVGFHLPGQLRCLPSLSGLLPHGRVRCHLLGQVRDQVRYLLLGQVRAESNAFFRAKFETEYDAIYEANQDHFYRDSFECCSVFEHGCDSNSRAE
jgi:hypothetical protein